MKTIVCILAAVGLFMSFLDVADGLHRDHLKREERDRKKRKYK